MPLSTFLANALWTASNLPPFWHFHHALREPQAVQQRKLRSLLKQNTNTAFGEAHGFGKIRRYDEFTRRVPLADYTALEPWIARIQQGEKNVLTREPVTHLVPTSGSTGARKLIPFTKGLQREFNAAIGPWLVDLAHQFPESLGGPAYWSITPAMGNSINEKSHVPIGFESDTSYLAGTRRILADAVMAVPSSVRCAKSLDAFRYDTLLHLLLCRELRLISVWHPSFLTLLLDALPALWKGLINDIKAGTPLTKADATRAAELCGGDPFKPETLWPNLRLISCWGDAAAHLSLPNLQMRFPNIALQPKGLVATECFVTLPFRRRYPLAITSHFFEFIDSEGRVLTLDALQEGQEYDIVVTTSGGLWRYQLGDRVRRTQCLEQTPCFEFLGRDESISDRCGEKLSEPFVAEALRAVFKTQTPQFMLLAPDQDEHGWCYTLYVEGRIPPHLAQTFEGILSQNPHYAYARALGQLLPVRVFLVAEKGFELFVRRQAAQSARLGDIKPAALSRISTWSKIFPGRYQKL